MISGDGPNRGILKGVFNEEPDEDVPDLPVSLVNASSQAALPISRNDLRYKITQSRDVFITNIVQDKTTKWADQPLWKEEPKYEIYQKQVEDLLKEEKEYKSDTFNELPSDKPLLNLLQYVLVEANNFVPKEQRLYKAKFLLQLIKDVDPAQLSPRSGPKPLHAAATFDINFRDGQKESDPDLTLFVCNLMGEKAAARISEVNELSENILHLAIQNDLKGTRDLIMKADQTAFIQRRVSRVAGTQQPNPDDGNTPLHDALNFSSFMMPGPSCTMSQARPGASQKEVTDDHETARSIISANTEVKVSADQDAQQLANQSKPRTNPASEMGDRVSQQRACNVCILAQHTNTTTLRKKKAIIRALLEKNPDPLEIHNSAGLPPYLYFLARRKDYEDDQLLSSTKLSRSLTMDGTVVDVTPGDCDNENREGRDDLYDEEKKLRNKKKTSEPVQQLHQAEPASGRKDGMPPRGAASLSTVVKEPLKTRVIQHTEKDLIEVDIGSNVPLKWLKDAAFCLGGYQKAYNCLFRGSGIQNTVLNGEIVRQRSFSLEGHQRVQVETTENFNFLIFEEMMASVVLSLEYTQEEELDMPDSEEKLVMWKQDEENLRRVFKWLKFEKKVKAIVSLVVKDNPNHYCSDNAVMECLKGLEIQYLDWNRPDLCANSSTLPDTLIEISLYWTGLNAVLWSWSDTEGLRTLKQLRRINFHPQTGADDEQKQEEDQQKVKAFKARIEKWPKSIEKPEIVDHDGKRRMKGNSKEGGTKSNSKFIKHSWIEDTELFAQELFNKHRETVLKNKSGYQVKLALLDDGVDPIYDHNGANLHNTGWPLLYSGGLDGSAQSFYVSTNHHGSKMASLIRKVCPFVTIYVAKLDATGGNDLRHRSFSVQQATEAIKWATAQKVDIISMSWNVREVSSPASNIADIRKLDRAIELAAEQKILMFGAACDIKESDTSEKWFPCDSPKVWSIGATDIHYDVQKYVPMNKKVNFLFPGEYVLNSNRKEDIVVGNSGATALAAGLAAAVIFCMKLDNKPLPDDRFTWMENVMKKVFNNDRNDSSVRVRGVLRLDSDGRPGELVRSFLVHRVS